MKKFINYQVKTRQLIRLLGGNNIIIVNPTTTTQINDFNSTRSNREKGN